MDIYKLIIKNFNDQDKIPLLTQNKYDIYLCTSSTKVNGQFHKEAISFEISKTNKKRITSQFIQLTYKYYEENKKSFPKREWYRTHKELSNEYKSRPCNYAVAQGLINETLKKLQL